MQKIFFRIMLLAAAAASLAGCLGGGGGGTALLPASDVTLPAGFSGDPTQTLGAELTGGGKVLVNLDGHVQSSGFVGLRVHDAIVYDSDLDQWTFNIDGTRYVAAAGLSGPYVAGPDCVCEFAFTPYGNSALSPQYGAFGSVEINIAGLPIDRAVHFSHYGLKTVASDMPISGSGTYTGMFTAVFAYESADTGKVERRDIRDPAVIAATFATGGGSVDFNYTATGIQLTGSGAITGNTFDGTMTGSATLGIDPEVFFATDGAGSTFSGAFYGPAPGAVGGGSEMAGVFYATTTAPAGDPDWAEVTGGFWGAETSFTP